MKVVKGLEEVRSYVTLAENAALRTIEKRLEKIGERETELAQERKALEAERDGIVAAVKHRAKPSDAR